MRDVFGIAAALKRRKEGTRRDRRSITRMEHREAAEFSDERQLLRGILDRGDVIALDTNAASKYRPDVQILLSLPFDIADELVAFGGEFEDDEDTDGGEDQQDLEPDESTIPMRQRWARERWEPSMLRC